MANIKEPYVEVKELVIATPSVGDVTNDLTIGGVIVAPTGPRMSLVSGPKDFLSKYTENGSIPRNADVTFTNAYYLSFSGPLLLERSLNTTAMGGVLFAKNAAPQVVHRKDGQMMTHSTEVTFQITEFANEGETSWAFLFGDTVYYCGDDESVDWDKFAGYPSRYECRTLKDVVAAIEKVDNLHVASKTYTKDGSGRIKTVVVDVEHTDAETIASTAASYTDNATVTAASTSSVITAPEDDWLFAVYGDTALSTDANSVKIPAVRDITGGKTFDLVLNGDKYLCSLQPDAVVDGLSVYIDYINTQGVGFSVDVYSNTGAPTAVTTAVAFGMSGLDMEECASPENMGTAWNELAEQEMYSVGGLSMFGCTDKTLVLRVQAIADSLKCMCPIDAPRTATTFSSVKSYFDGIAEKTPIPKGIALGPFEKNISLLGWTTYIAASTLYWERVYQNKSASAEFAGVFSFNNGRLNYTNPVKMFGKTEREALLNLGKPVNWAMYNYERNVYYLNDNRTLQPDKTTIVAEECICRQVLKISRDVDRIMHQFLGEHNTTSTQNKVEDALNYYLDWNIMNQRYKPDAYQVICADDVLNNDEVKNSNGLRVIVKVRYNRSIKEIIVTNEVYPIGVDFSTTL